MISVSAKDMALLDIMASAGTVMANVGSCVYMGPYFTMIMMVIMTWTCFPPYWPSVKGFHQLLVDSLHKGPVRQSCDGGFELVQTSCETNSRVSSNLRCHDAPITSL